jgi:hypothetical protein
MHPIRSSAAIVVALALALAALTPVVMAQEDAAEHPLVGAWVLDATPAASLDPTPAASGEEPYVMLIAGPGGTLINDSLDGVGYGAWAPTGERTAILTILTQSVEPDTGYGFFTIRASVVVAPDGQSFTGTWTIEFPRGEGQARQEYGPGEISAERIEAEELGTPVGPIP